MYFTLRAVSAAAVGSVLQAHVVGSVPRSLLN